FILLAKDSGMEVWNDTGSGFLAVGGSFFVGQPPFDTHPLWNIPDSLATGSKSLSLKLHDVNGIYSDSGPITLSFQPIPEPAITGIAPGFLSVIAFGRKRK